MPETGSTIEQDIIQLEQQLKEKKAALEGGEVETRQEKELLREATGEKIKQHIPQYQSQSSQNSDQLPTADIESELKDEARKFVNLIFEKNLEEGIKEIANINNPALTDAFHSLLVDELYDRMVKEGKLEKLT